MGGDKKMKDSQIRVCGRAAQTDSGAGGAVMFGCLAAAGGGGGVITGRGPGSCSTPPR